MSVPQNFDVNAPMGLTDWFDANHPGQMGQGQGGPGPGDNWGSNSPPTYGGAYGYDAFGQTSATGTNPGGRIWGDGQGTIPGLPGGWTGQEATLEGGPGGPPVPRGGELGPKTGGGTDWWNNPNFGAPPSPYTSASWTGGPAPTFHAPTMADLTNDPGYQARLAAGQQGMDRSAAARGTLLTGGAQKALARYGQDYASNEFGKVADRANTDFTNQNTAYQTNYGTYLGENARTLSDWLQNLTAKRNAEQDYWSRLQGVSGNGLTAGTQGQGA